MGLYRTDYFVIKNGKEIRGSVFVEAADDEKEIDKQGKIKAAKETGVLSQHVKITTIAPLD